MDNWGFSSNTDDLVPYCPRAFSTRAEMHMRNALNSIWAFGPSEPKIEEPRIPDKRVSFRQDEEKRRDDEVTEITIQSEPQISAKFEPEVAESVKEPECEVTLIENNAPVFQEEQAHQVPQIMISELLKVMEPTKSKKLKSARRSMPHTSREIPQDPSFSDYELRLRISQMMTNNMLPRACYHDPIVEFIRRERESLDSSDPYAIELDCQLEKFMALKSAQFGDNEQLKKKQMLESKLSVSQNTYHESKKQWTDKIKASKSEFRQKIRQLENQHSNEIAEFEKNWHNPVFLAQYAKPSPRLLHLREIEQKLVSQKHFDRAQMVKKQADALQKEETAIAKERIANTMKVQLSSIEMRQKREMECAMQRGQRIIENMEQERDRQIVPLGLVVNRLNDDVNQIRKPAKSRRSLVRIIKSARQ